MPGEASSNASSLRCTGLCVSTSNIPILSIASISRLAFSYYRFIKDMNRKCVLNFRITIFSLSQMFTHSHSRDKLLLLYRLAPSPLIFTNQSQTTAPSFVSTCCSISSLSHWACLIASSLFILAFSSVSFLCLS